MREASVTVTGVSPPGSWDATVTGSVCVGEVVTGVIAVVRRSAVDSPTYVRGFAARSRSASGTSGPDAVGAGDGAAVFTEHPPRASTATRAPAIAAAAERAVVWGSSFMVVR
jgi:hypothetical protein